VTFESGRLATIELGPVHRHAADRSCLGSSAPKVGREVLAAQRRTAIVLAALDAELWRDAVWLTFPHGPG
jgi:hypothetical protein